MLTNYIANGISHHGLVNDSTLHVVAPVSNPARYHSRYKIFRDFAAAMRHRDYARGERAATALVGRALA